MNEEIIGIEVSGEIYPIKDEETSGKAQTLETKIQGLKTIVDTHSEELRELTMMIDDATVSNTKTWSSEKINDSLEDIEKKAGIIYSTDEVVIGKWIDGKPIYRKVFPIGRKTFSENQVVITTELNNKNVSTMIKADLTWVRGSSQFAFTTYWQIYIRDNDISSTSRGSAFTTGSDAVAIFEYTKITD